MATKFEVELTQDLKASRLAPNTVAVVTLHLTSRQEAAGLKQDVDLYFVALRLVSDVEELRQDETVWSGHTPMAALDQALAFAALALRGKYELGWRFQPEDSAVRQQAVKFGGDQGVDIPVGVKTFAGSLIFSGLLSASGVPI